jgi:hypothetical protein
MFIQIIQGKVKDRALLERQMESWRRQLKPGAKGYLGSTSGITPDGRGITLARFESEAAASANSERPEQGKWWSDTEKAFDGDPTFYNCRDVDTMFGGGSNDAGFVQVIQARADQNQMRSRRAEIEQTLRERRRDILGMVVGWHGDGGFTQAVYFTSEEDARRGEKETEQDEMRREFMSLMEAPPTFFDLTSPELD